MMPKLEKNLASKSWDITPYVNVFNEGPEKGFSQFLDSPRYSAGYTTLWNTLGMMVETHMLKPYKQRVEGTYELMKSMIEIVETDSEKIKELRVAAFKNSRTTKNYPIDWEIDTTKTTVLKFKGFDGKMIKSEITGTLRLKYDSNKPFTKDVVYQNYFKPSIEVSVPKAYIIPKGWWNVIDLLKLNKVEMTQLKNDTILEIESYKIDTFERRKNAYEGHYQHYNTKIISSDEKMTFREGDYYINTNQRPFRY